MSEIDEINALLEPVGEERPVITNRSVPTRTLEETEELLQGAAAHDFLIARNALVYLLCLKSDLESARDQRDEARRLRDDAVIARNNAIDELDGFKTRVRNAAIEVQAQHSGHMSIPQLNEVLDDLGLDKVVTKWSVTATWNDIDLPEAIVTADDEQEAEDKYREALRRSQFYVALRLSGTAMDTDKVSFGDNYPDNETDWSHESDFDASDVDITVEEADE